jgi:tRNA pseudouridine55 synthase
MRRYAIIHKEIGQTPLEAASAWKQQSGVPDDLPISYAGRLDPMASGKLLILLGEECKRQKAYTGLDKEYVVEVLLGVRTDTGDVLGRPELSDRSPALSTLRDVLRDETGTFDRSYPVFSSKTVSGKPLFMYALEGTLESIAIPTHPETVYRIQLLGTEPLPARQLESRVLDLLSKAPTSNEPSKALGADFRIGTIRPEWEDIFLVNPDHTFTVLTLKVTCGSGTYMRTLAERIGEALGTYGQALSINRTRIGRFQRSPFGFWRQEYR